MRRLRLIALLFACTVATTARAQFPERPIHLIVPQAAGSATDTVARILAAALADQIGQQVIVDDRPGGALTVGLDLRPAARDPRPRPCRRDPEPDPAGDQLRPRVSVPRAAQPLVPASSVAKSRSNWYESDASSRLIGSPVNAAVRLPRMS